MVNARIGASLLAVALVVAAATHARPAAAASAAEINRDVDAALAQLYASVPSARSLARRAKGILVFPAVVKAGFMFGAQYGDGALRRGGRTVGYYNTAAASYGFQAGIQSLRLRAALHDRFRARVSRQERGVRARSGTEHRYPRRGEGELLHHVDHAGRHLRVHLRPEGADGRDGDPGFEDQPDRALSLPRAAAPHQRRRACLPPGAVNTGGR